MTRNSLFVVIEGIDGSGSSTHSRILSGFLESKNYKVYLTQEPSNSEIGLLLRKFLKDDGIPPSVDALLFAADRSFHYHNDISKKLEEGYIVISDRYVESSIIYQSVQSDEISIGWVKEINKFIGIPDITIVLDINPKISLARKVDSDLEKFEESDFLEKVRDLYLSRAKSENYFVINSDNVIEIVQEKVQKIVMDALKA